jgi:hypothetical protein
MVLENPQKAQELLGQPDKLAAEFGTRLSADKLDAIVRTVAELNDQGIVGLGPDGKNIAESEILSSPMDEVAGVVHTDSSGHVNFQECAHVVTDPPARGMQVADPAPFKAQSLASHVIQNFDKFQEFQQNPTALAEQFGTRQDLAKVKLVLNTIQNLASQHLGQANQSHIEDVLGPAQGETIQGR